jgi:hypothetical protein
VTFSVHSIPPLLREKAMVKENHSGVIFISSKSFAENDHGGLTQALASIPQAEAEADRANRIMFLSRTDALKCIPNP